MPDFNDFGDAYTANNFGGPSSMNMGDFGSVTLNQQAAAAQAHMSQPEGYNWATTIGGDAAFGIADLADTVASSIPFASKALGIQRGDLNQGLLNMIGSPGLQDFYDQNQGGIHFASAMYGAVAADLATGGLMGAAPFVSVMSKVGWAKKALALDGAAADAIKAVNVADTTLATKGVLGTEAFTQAMGDAGVVKLSAAGLDTGLAGIARNKLYNKAIGLSFAKGAVRAAATEGTMGIFLNQNDFLYDSDVGHNLANAALGAGIGGVISGVMTKYALRKFVSSDQFRKVVSGALDPTGLMDDINVAPTAPDATTQQKLSSTYLGNLQGTKSDLLTAQMVAARQKVPDGVDKTFFDRLSTQYEQMANEQLGKITSKGLWSVYPTGFGSGDKAFYNHVTQALHKDAGTMMGVEMAGGATPELGGVGGLHDTIQKNLDTRLTEVQDQIANKAEFDKLTDQQKINVKTQLKQLKFMKTLVPTPLVDGQVTTLSHASVFDNWVEPQIKVQTDADDPTYKFFEAHDPGGKTSRKIGVDTQGEVFLPGDRTVNNASTDDMLNLFRSGQQLVNHYAKTGAPMILPSNPSWFHLDMAEQLLRANKNATVQFPAGMSRESAMLESFAQKVDAVKALGGKLTPDQMPGMTTRFNLPRLSAFEQGTLMTDQHPMDVLLRGAIQMGGGNAVRASTLGDIQSGINAQRQISGLANKVSSTADDMQGNSFNFLMDDNGNTVKPVLMYRRPFMQQDWAPDRLAERIALNKAGRIQQLLKSNTGVMSKALTNVIAQSPDADQAAGINGLTDVQIPGFLGQAPQSGLGRLNQGVQTAEFRARDLPPILAATRLRESVDRISQGFMKDQFQGNLGDLLTTVNGPRNTSSRFLLNQFHTFGYGWDLTPKPIETTLADGSKGWAFGLDSTQGNADRFEQMFGRKMAEGETLKTPDGKNVLLDDLGLQVQQGFNKITDQLLQEKNTLNSAVGVSTISRKNWFIPGPNPEGKYVGYIMDPNKNVVSTVMSPTQDGFTKLINDLKADPNSMLARDGYDFKTQNEVKMFSTLLDRAQMDMMNPGRTFIQGGKSATGKLASPVMNMNAFDDSLAQVRNEYIQHGRDILESLYEDPVKAAKARTAIVSPEQVQGSTPFGIKQGGKNVYDYYLDALLGRNPIQNDKSIIGRLQATLEQPINAAIQSTASKIRSNTIYNAVHDYIGQVNPYSGDASTKKLFQTLTDKLGPDMPFDSVSKMMEAQGYGAAPATLKGITSNLSRFEATWVLRMMEPIQAVMNLTGVINAIPAVVRGVSQREGESVADYAARIGHSASIFPTDQGNAVGVVSTPKLMWNGFKRAWSGAADGDWQRLADKGMMSQEVAEFQRAFNAAENRGQMDLFLNGDPSSKSAFGKKGLVGWLSLLTDKSEDFSRAWAHMCGDETANLMGMPVGEARDAFAHDIANKAIANYNPLNRPAIFQGALGTPIGLFQGFIWAYYQRLFRYLETGDKVALATQYATQAASFGLKTVPGFNELNSLWFQHANGQNSPYDEIYKRFGQPAGDLLMGGVYGNLPKIFGGKAIDLSARGDTSFKVPNIIDPTGAISAPPAIATTAKKVIGGIGQALKLFSSANPHLAKEEVAEIASNMIPNRPMAGFIEQFGAGGADTDASGQLVTQAHDWTDMTARLLGVRSLQQSNEIQAFYSNKQAREIQAQQQETLNANTRALIRSGDTSNVMGVYESYVANGGDPRNFKRWVQSTFKTATQTRGVRQLTQALHSPTQEALADRLLGQQVGISDEMAAPDPRMMQMQDSMENQLPTNSPTDNTDQMYGQEPMFGSGM